VAAPKSNHVQDWPSLTFPKISAKSAYNLVCDPAEKQTDQQQINADYHDLIGGGNKESIWS